MRGFVWHLTGHNYTSLVRFQKSVKMTPMYTWGVYLNISHPTAHTMHHFHQHTLACWYFLIPAYVQMLPPQQSEKENKVEGNEDMEKRQLEGWQQEENPPLCQIARICLSDRSSNAAPATTSVRLKEMKKLEVEDNIKKHQLKDDNNKNREIRNQVARICLSAHWRRKTEWQIMYEILQYASKHLGFRYPTIENAYFSLFWKKSTLVLPVVLHSSDPMIRWAKIFDVQLYPSNHKEFSYGTSTTTIEK